VSAEGLAWRYYRIRSNVGVGGGPPSALRDAFRWANIGIWQNLRLVTIFHSPTVPQQTDRERRMWPSVGLCCHTQHTVESRDIVSGCSGKDDTKEDVDVARRRKNDGPFESWNLEVLAHGLSRASPNSRNLLGLYIYIFH
jgi:hypothetical protein